MKVLIITIFLILLIPIGLLVNANGILVVEGTNIILAQTGLDEILASTKVRGYDGTNFGDMVGGMFIKAGETFTSSAQGIYIVFQTTPLNSITPVDVFKINSDGSIGINQTKLCLDSLDCSGNDYIISNSNGNTTIYSAGNKIQLPNNTGTLALAGESGSVVNTQTASNDIFITGINNVTGVITTNQFSVNTQSSLVDRQITGINNVTGEITRNTFSVNTKDCGTEAVKSIDNSTGNITCIAVGGGTAREETVALWGLDKTWTNIGLVYVDVYLTANSNGEGIRIDTNGKTTVTSNFMWTKTGAGTMKCRIVDIASASNILIIDTDMVSGQNTNATQNIPAGLLNTIKTYKPQCLSSTAADDPIFLSGQVLLR